MGAGEAQTDLFLFCRPLRLPQPLYIGQEWTRWVVLYGRDYIWTGHVWVQLSVRVLYLLAIGQGKKGATIYRHRAPFIIQKASMVVLVSRILSGPSVVIISFVS